MAQESSEEERNEEKEVVAIKDAQVMAEKSRRRLTWGPTCRNQGRSQSVQVSEKEKSKLIALLKEYKDVLA